MASAVVTALGLALAWWAESVEVPLRSPGLIRAVGITAAVFFGVGTIVLLVREVRSRRRAQLPI